MRHAYLATVCRDLGAEVVRVGGVADHVHIVTTLPRTVSQAQLIEEIKKTSSKWIKTLDARYRSFFWQRGYGAFSVSPSQLEAVLEYVDTQQEHHRTRTFQEEYRELLRRHGVDFDEAVRLGLRSHAGIEIALSALVKSSGNRIPGALPQADMTERPWRSADISLFADPTFRRAIGESSALTPHQLRSWKPGSYAAWPSLRAPNASGPLHLGGTGEIPSVPCPRRVRSFAACTYVK